MHLHFRNAESAFNGLVKGISQGEIVTDVQPSRNGEVIRVTDPSIISYHKPLERVIFNPVRDANPFFHLYESLWMLAGRNDLESVRWFVDGMKNFSDDGETLNGAYGYRWRHARFNIDPTAKLGYGRTDFDVGEHDQLVMLVEHLRDNPHSRRAVLQMWNVEDDQRKIDKSKDVCCNLSVVFEIEMGAVLGMGHEVPKYLNMSVFNRSNDMILGMLGANVVHFSVLQEYMAAHLGLEVGSYHQITTNLHAYSDNWKPDKWLACAGERYSADEVKPARLVANPKQFDKELPIIVGNYKGDNDPKLAELKEPFFRNVAWPMIRAYRLHKERDYDAALSWMAFASSAVPHCDWLVAGAEWLTRRRNRYLEKKAAKA